MHVVILGVNVGIFAYGYGGKYTPIFMYVSHYILQSLY